MEPTLSENEGDGRSRRGAVLREDDGRLVRGRHTRGRLRRWARELILERGFDKTPLTLIAERAGIGTSTIYRHVKTKEELLMWELEDVQSEAWTRFRLQDDRSRPSRERIRRFFEVQHELLAESADYTMIVLRATASPRGRAAKQARRLRERNVGLLTEILQSGRKNGDLAPDIDVMAAAEALFDGSASARIDWARGWISEQRFRRRVERFVDLLFRGIGPHR